MERASGLEVQFLALQTLIIAAVRMMQVTLPEIAEGLLSRVAGDAFVQRPHLCRCLLNPASRRPRSGVVLRLHLLRDLRGDLRRQQSVADWREATI
jgi:hypothetical protein